MAKKDENKIMLERTYNVPLRREFLKVPKYKRAKKATTALREFLQRHMKSEDIKIGQALNMEVWRDGIRNPPHHIEVHAVKYESGEVRAEIVGVAIEEKKELPKKKDDKKSELEAKKAKIAEEVKRKIAEKKASKGSDTDAAKGKVEERPSEEKAKEAKEPKTETKAPDKSKAEPSSKTAKQETPKKEAVPREDTKKETASKEATKKAAEPPKQKPDAPKKE